VWHADGLAADISNVPLYMVARLAREHVPVVLSGDGGDEMFAGYPTYRADRMAVGYRRLPAPLRRVLRAAARKLPTSTAKMSLDYTLTRFLDGAELPDAAESHLAWRTIFTDAERVAVTAGSLRSNAKDDLAAVFRGAPAVTDLQRAIYADVQTFLVDSILAKVDAMTMAHGLEARVPFLDDAVVDTAARVPDRRKFGSTGGKLILREAMRTTLPASVVRRRKSPFQPPLAAWLRTELRDTVCDTLSGSRVTRLGFLDAAAVDVLKQQHFAGTANNAFKLWSLMNLVEWHRLFVDGAWASEQPSGPGGSLDISSKPAGIPRAFG
jgi:asparagine synthase (glutamine-hydrolysing)